MHSGGRIGDNAIIGSGAEILLEVNIGNDVKIGVSCAVVEDVPDNATVVFQKARIILK